MFFFINKIVFVKIVFVGFFFVVVFVVVVRHRHKPQKL